MGAEDVVLGRNLLQKSGGSWLVGSPVRTALLQLTVKEISRGRSVLMREDLLWSTMEKKKLKSVGDGRPRFCERELLRGR
jgi:hypothetical protein